MRQSPFASALGPVARAGARAGRPVNVSFEFGPPKTDEAEEALWLAIRRLEPLNPTFVSVTYGAGGSTRDRTHRTVTRMLAETTLRPAAHLTCVEASRAEVDEVVRDPDLLDTKFFYQSDSSYGNIPQIGLGIAIDGKQDIHRKAPPALGEDTGTVLREWLGKSEFEIGALKKSGII